MVTELQQGDPPLMGPYRLVGRLGRGRMGQVFLGLTDDGQPVAVKVIRTELAANPEFRTGFGRELAAARRVRGSFTVAVVDGDADGPVPWLATTYVVGPSLSEAISAKGPLPTRSVRVLAAGLAEGLSAIHAAGMVHGDLGPSNVLLAEDGPRLADFGISRAVTRAGLLVGTPGFISPEQAVGHGADSPSDIFSLGMVIAFAATGRRPTAALYRAGHKSPSLDLASAEVRQLVEWCLAKDPSERPTADSLLTAVGPIVPAADWLPESITRTFVADAENGAALAAFGGSPGSGQTALAARDVGSAAQVPGADDRTRASSAGNPPAVTSERLPQALRVVDGPPGPGRSRPPRRPKWRTAVVAWVIGGLLVVSAVTAAIAHSANAPVPSKHVAVPASTTASASASPSVSPSWSGSASPSASPSGSPSGSASPSWSGSASPSASPSGSPSGSASSSWSGSASPSASPSASGSESWSASQSPTTRASAEPSSSQSPSSSRTVPPFPPPPPSAFPSKLPSLPPPPPLPRRYPPRGARTRF